MSRVALAREHGRDTAPPPAPGRADPQLQAVIVSDFAIANGGAAKVAIDSARGLAEQGVRVIFVCAMAPVGADLAHPGIQVRCVGIEEVWRRRNPLTGALAAIWNIHAARHITRLLDELPDLPTVVHFHQWSKAFSPSALAAARRTGRPCLVSMHDYFLACPNGIYFDHGAALPCTRRPLSAACIGADCDARSRRHKAVRLVRQVGIKHATAPGAGPGPLDIVHVSAFARRVAAPLLATGGRHFVVPNPVDIAHAAPVRVRDNREFVFLGRLIPEKRPRLLAQAAARAGVPATFLGTGPEAAAIRAANPAARVLGWGDGAAVGALLERARALVFPSIWPETSGLVVAEALARGVPALVSDATAAADLIEHDVNGLLCRSGDLDALTAAIRRLAHDATAERLGRQAHAAYWRAPLTRAVHIERLLAVYDTVLAGSTSGEDRLRLRG